MAKRFTDTDKWKKKWFRSLTPGIKLFWQYLLDSCDHAGIWEVDFDLAAFQIGMNLDEHEIMAAIRGKVTPLENGERWFINEFVDFQYGELRENNKAHASVARILTRHGVSEKPPFVYQPKGEACQPLASTISGDKDKEKAKELATDKALVEDEDTRVDHRPTQYCRKHGLKHTDAYCPRCLRGD